MQDGSHPIWDRDDVHEIYREWRQVFEEYSPPRIGVAEAWVSSERRPLYASAEGLGQAFNFDLLEADFDAAQFRDIVSFNLGLSETSGSSSTWVFSNHDVVRHATRYGLPTPAEDPQAPADEKAGTSWLLSATTSIPVPSRTGTTDRNAVGHRSSQRRTQERHSGRFEAQPGRRTPVIERCSTLL